MCAYNRRLTWILMRIYIYITPLPTLPWTTFFHAWKMQLPWKPFYEARLSHIPLLTHLTKSFPISQMQIPQLFSINQVPSSLFSAIHIMPTSPLASVRQGKSHSKTPSRLVLKHYESFQKRTIIYSMMTYIYM